MRVLITGATGLVGTHLTKLCREKGIAVNYLTTSREKIEQETDYHGFLWDPNSQQLDKACFKEVDAIIHLAGATIAQRWTDKNRKKIIDSRVKSANLLFNSLQKSSYKIPFFISASAIGIYPSSLQKLYYEDYEAVDDSFLGEVVERWEAAADQFKNTDTKVAKVRTGLVLAKDGGALPKLKDPASFNVGAALGSGRQWQSWIHIKDLANIYLHIVENNLEGVYNAVAPNPVTNKELTEEIAGQLGKSVWLPNVPSVALKLVLGEMSQVLLSSQLVSSDKIEQSGYTFIYKNVKKALADLL